MSHVQLSDITSTLVRAIAAQMGSVIAWHKQEPKGEPDTQATAPLEQLEQLILAQHCMNYRLWHVEDTARRKDVDATVIADCKQRIDALNQQRNDYMEKVDTSLINLLKPLLPPLPPGREIRHNTESAGMSIDRLSILSLKIFHMDEQTKRDDVDAVHRTTCQEKLAVLREQHADLLEAVLDLVAEYAVGVKQPKVYYQFKMYNDPSLNPELYDRK